MRGSGVLVEQRGGSSYPIMDKTRQVPLKINRNSVPKVAPLARMADNDLISVLGRGMQFAREFLRMIKVPCVL